MKPGVFISNVHVFFFVQAFWMSLICKTLSMQCFCWQMRRPRKNLCCYVLITFADTEWNSELKPFLWPLTQDVWHFNLTFMFWLPVTNKTEEFWQELEFHPITGIHTDHEDNYNGARILLPKNWIRLMIEATSERVRIHSKDVQKWIR